MCERVVTHFTRVMLSKTVVCCEECIHSKHAAPCESAGTESSRSHKLQTPKVFLRSAERPCSQREVNTWKVLFSGARYNILMFIHVLTLTAAGRACYQYYSLCRLVHEQEFRNTDLRLVIFYIFLIVNTSHKKLKTNCRLLTSTVPQTPIVVQTLLKTMSCHSCSGWDVLLLQWICLFWVNHTNNVLQILAH